jgi:glycerol kinase
MTNNNLFNQVLANISGVTIKMSPNSEMTSIGAGILAGLGAGIFNLKDFNTPIENKGTLFLPGLSDESNKYKRNHWKKAIKALENFYTPN